jgi:hypothetical protein
MININTNIDNAIVYFRARFIKMPQAMPAIAALRL